MPSNSGSILCNRFCVVPYGMLVPCVCRMYCILAVYPNCPLISSHVRVAQWHMLVFHCANTLFFFYLSTRSNEVVSMCVFFYFFFQIRIFSFMCGLSIKMCVRFLAHQPKMCRYATCHTSNTAPENRTFRFFLHLFIVVIVYTINSARFLL